MCVCDSFPCRSSTTHNTVSVSKEPGVSSYFCDKERIMVLSRWDAKYQMQVDLHTCRRKSPGIFWHSPLLGPVLPPDVQELSTGLLRVHRARRVQ